MRRKAFTLIELLVVVAIIALLISILLPSLARARELSKRTVCMANLKGVGTAIATYSSDSNQSWPIPPYKDPTVTTAGQSAVTYIGQIGANRTAPTVGGANGTAAVSTTRCFWMLIKDNATSPGQFICPSSDDNKAGDPDPASLYDFPGYKSVSYGIQMPFGNVGRPKGEKGDASAMPMGADKGPWAQETGGPTGPGAIPAAMDAVNSALEAWRPYNSYNHGQLNDGEGQNVLYGDYHCDFNKKPAIGIGYDNIYTCWTALLDPKPWLGKSPLVTGTGTNTAPWSDTDSMIYP